MKKGNQKNNKQKKDKDMLKQIRKMVSLKEKLKTRDNNFEETAFQRKKEVGQVNKKEK